LSNSGLLLIRLAICICVSSNVRTAVSERQLFYIGIYRAWRDRRHELLKEICAGERGINYRWLVGVLPFCRCSPTKPESVGYRVEGRSGKRGVRLKTSMMKRHIWGDDRLAAARMVERMPSAVDQLASHPALGRLGRVPGTRELVISGTPYIVPYRVRSDTVEVLRVFHGGRGR
jgi:toxin ParE1/3/4